MEHTDELTKSLASLIEETISEIDELRKSRFAATEVSLDAPGESLNAKAPGSSDVNGSLGKEEDEKDEDEEEEKEEEAEKAEVEKAEDKEDSEKDEDEEDKKDKKKMEKMDGDSAAAVDVNAAQKAEQPAEGYEIKKSLEETEGLMKSYVESRVAPLEEKLKAIHALVEQIADQPVPSKSFAAKAVPLSKSEEEFEVKTLSKSEVTNKLLELKKSGKSIDDLDFTKIDLGTDLGEIARKYGLN